MCLVHAERARICRRLTLLAVVSKTWEPLAKTSIGNALRKYDRKEGTRARTYLRTIHTLLHKTSGRYCIKTLGCCLCTQLPVHPAMRQREGGRCSDYVYPQSPQGGREGRLELDAPVDDSAHKKYQKVGIAEHATCCATLTVSPSCGLRLPDSLPIPPSFSSTDFGHFLQHA